MMSGGAKGMCPAHYKRELRGASLDAPLVERNRSLLDKFHAYARQPEDTSACWTWNGSYGGGLPVVGDGRALVSAAQVAWEIANDRAFPSGLVAHRQCATNNCVNPSHIIAVKRSKHSRMQGEEGRAAHGERNASAVVTAEQAEEIARRRAQEEDAKLLGMEYGITDRQVYNIAKGTRWKRRP